MSDYKIDPLTWYTERKMNTAPKHFTVSATPLSSDSESWVVNKLKGRYAIVNSSTDTVDFSVPLFLLTLGSYLIAFEDPGEAVLFELTWS